MVAAAEAVDVAPVPLTDLFAPETRVLLLDVERAGARIEAFAADLDDVFGDGEGRNHYLPWDECAAVGALRDNGGGRIGADGCVCRARGWATRRR